MEAHDPVHRHSPIPAVFQASLQPVERVDLLEASQNHRRPSFGIDPMSLYASHACVSFHDHVPPFIYADITLEPYRSPANTSNAMAPGFGDYSRLLNFPRKKR